MVLGDHNSNINFKSVFFVFASCNATWSYKRHFDNCVLFGHNLFVVFGGVEEDIMSVPTLRMSNYKAKSYHRGLKKQFTMLKY